MENRDDKAGTLGWDPVTGRVGRPPKGRMTKAFDALGAAMGRELVARFTLTRYRGRVLRQGVPWAAIAIVVVAYWMLALALATPAKAQTTYEGSPDWERNLLLRATACIASLDPYWRYGWGTMHKEAKAWREALRCDDALRELREAD